MKTPKHNVLTVLLSMQLCIAFHAVGTELCVHLLLMSVEKADYQVLAGLPECTDPNTEKQGGRCG